MTPENVDRLLDAIPKPFLYLGWIVAAAALIWLFGAAGAAAAFLLPLLVLGLLALWESAWEHWRKRRAGR